MNLDILQLTDYRNISSICLEPSPGLNVITGENAQGKSNILESICYLCLMSSFRGAKDSFLVRFGTQTARIEARVHAEERERVFRISIPSSGRRSVEIGGVKINKKSEAAGILRCVLFCPDDLSLIRQSPSVRRKFIDDAICQLKPNYMSYLSEYNRNLANKMRILKDYHTNPSLLDTLDIFSEQLCKYGAYIIPYRQAFCEKLESYAKEEHEKMSSGREQLSLKYKTVSTIPDAHLSQKEIYDLLWQHYISHRASEIASSSCLSGPHKDDLEIMIDNVPAKTFASQGQTRTAVLSLKLAQRELFARTTGEYPILLFDDVLSELDSKRQEYVLSGTGRGQVFITACESRSCLMLDEMLKNNENGAKLFHVKQGRLV